MDTKNTFIQHSIVGLLFIGLVSLFHYGFGASWVITFARVAFILLSLTLMIGPIMTLKKSGVVSSPLKSPWSWRGELGIWFAISSIIHFILFMNGFPKWNLLKALGGGIGGGGLGIATFIGLIALFWTIILTIASFNKIIVFLGTSWKWIHSFTYVVFYLIVSHLTYFQFFSTYRGGPDWFGYTSIVIALIVMGLQFSAFVKILIRNRKNS